MALHLVTGDVALSRLIIIGETVEGVAAESGADAERDLPAPARFHTSGARAVPSPGPSQAADAGGGGPRRRGPGRLPGGQRSVRCPSVRVSPP
ncbi:hypothetical protein GCM10010349_43620 [Streptomyces flavofungini]|nr:hypothetical protein GCM10010349_43620 [Streptomyces flavofungini]